ncbi:hypothetical protein QIH93_15100 [Bradyrhizobium ottawaense]|uniref:hypothetical protein n=1 Tax=Bradyrhizobium ottawaense TaxID=931866 RepID=UPI0027145807|nr:hypothetical protein [Bradyrhizobium ottawaense]WLB49240.1 hypothetical protein QIH93_15100 [Bradyrhizobium ottawaense]
MIDWFKEKFAAIREKLKGWKTVIIGAVVALPLSLLEILQQLQMIDLNSVLPEPWGARLALVVSVAMILLRLITNTPVGKAD